MVGDRIHYDSLDGLRGFSALAVLAFHTSIPIFWLGWAGVQFFFCLSGFLITSILIESGKANNYFKIFYARRILRIFPIYFLILFGVFFIAVTLKLNVNDFWLYILYIQNFKLSFQGWSISFPNWLNHTWSLAIEEQFYIFFPFLVYYLSERLLVIACVILIFTAIFTRYFLSVKYPGNSIVWANTLSNLDFLSAGALLSIGLKQGKSKLIKTVLLSLLGLTVVYFLFNQQILKNPIDLTSINGQIFLIGLLIFASFVVIILTKKRGGG